MKKKDNIGFLVAVIVVALVVTHILAFSSGRKHAEKTLNKEAMITERVKDLEHELKLSEKVGRIWIEENSKQSDLIVDKTHSIAVRIWALSDTLRYVAPSYVKERLDEIAIDVVGVMEL